MKSWSYRLAGIFVSVLFVYLAVRKVDFSESLRTLASVQPAILGAATLVYLTGIPVRALRWQLILRAQKPLSWREVLVPFLVGHMANNVLPARAGEIYRAHFLGRRVQMSRSGIVGSIVVERTFDGLTLIGMMLFVLVLFPQEHFLGAAAFVTGLIFIGLAISLTFYGFSADKVQRGIERGLSFLPLTLRRFIEVRLSFFLRGIRGFLKGGVITRVGLLTVLIWAIEVCAIALAVVSFGVVLPVSGYLLVYTLAALSTTLPSGPGYIGPFQYAFVLALGVFAVSRETALAVSVASQIALLGSVVVLGLAFLWRENLRAGPLPDRSEQEKADYA